MLRLPTFHLGTTNHDNYVENQVDYVQYPPFDWYRMPVESTMNSTCSAHGPFPRTRKTRLLITKIVDAAINLKNYRISALSGVTGVSSAMLETNEVGYFAFGVVVDGFVGSQTLLL